MDYDRKGLDPSDINLVERVTWVRDTSATVLYEGEAGAATCSDADREELRRRYLQPDRFRLDIQECRVRCRRPVLELLLEELFTNALKYSAPSRPIDVRVLFDGDWIDVRLDNALEFDEARGQCGVAGCSATPVFDVGNYIVFERDFPQYQCIDHVADVVGFWTSKLWTPERDKWTGGTGLGLEFFGGLLRDLYQPPPEKQPRAHPVREGWSRDRLVSFRAFLRATSTT